MQLHIRMYQTQFLTNKALNFKKQKKFLQISVRDLHNVFFKPVSQGELSGAQDEEGRVCIGDTSIRNHISKLTNSCGNINKITCRCETCISDMFLQYD